MTLFSKDTKLRMHSRIYDSILDTIGATPIVRLSRFKEKYKLKADLLAKLEYFNPMASVKDRAALAMIEAAELEGKIISGKTTIVEPTSGNTGIALAFICAYKGYSLILVMPENMSAERKKMLRYLGVELILTSAEKGMQGAIDEAQSILKASKNAYCPGQFTNAANAQIHEETTAAEIWADTNGNIDIFICAVGTGGTLTGTARGLKKHNSNIKIFAVEPEESPVISGGNAGAHAIQGIGAGFIPDLLDMEIIDEILHVNSDASMSASRELALLEGIPCGISSGAVLEAAKIVAASSQNKGKQVVTIIPSFAERYLSSALFNC